MRPIRLETGEPLIGMLARPGEDRLCGGFHGVIAGVGIDCIIDPLGGFRLRALIGTASSDPWIGFLLPPGPYEAVILMNVYALGWEDRQRDRRDRLVSPRTSIELT
jgi:hypothetical protein